MPASCWERTTSLSDNCLTENGQYGFSAYTPDGVEQHHPSPQRDQLQRHLQLGNGGPGLRLLRVAGSSGRPTGRRSPTTTSTTTRTSGLGRHRQRRLQHLGQLHLEQLLAKASMYEISYNARSRTTPSSATPSAPARPTRASPTGAIYISESGSDSRVAGAIRRARSTSPATSSPTTGRGSCCGRTPTASAAHRTTRPPGRAPWSTLPGQQPQPAPRRTCRRHPSQTPIDYYDDCRWKTQNISVTTTPSTSTPSAVGAIARSPTAAASRGCSPSTAPARHGPLPG